VTYSSLVPYAGKSRVDHCRYNDKDDDSQSAKSVWCNSILVSYMYVIPETTVRAILRFCLQLSRSCHYTPILTSSGARESRPMHALFILDSLSAYHNAIHALLPCRVHPYNENLLIMKTRKMRLVFAVVSRALLEEMRHISLAVDAKEVEPVYASVTIHHGRSKFSRLTSHLR
jgi:hypothetical protein